MRLSKITVITMAGLLSTAFVNTQARADCNVELPYNQLIDCIIVEGAETPYNAAEEQDTGYTSENTSKQNRKKPNASNLAVVK